ncbi:MAG TPA: UDP-glucose 4-epimerase GalE [Thermohalobaculum sp.]|nr:UDP-glucose 4-epimerase GalE [Thermohalobaculum sp.]
MAVVLVTGGAGYIGAHACRQLAEAGHRPVVFDDFSTGWRDSVRFGPLIEGDLLNSADLDRAFATEPIDAVMHFAARSLVGQSMTNPELYWSTNVCGSLNLLEAMRRAGIARIVFSSTAATYGEPDLDLIPEAAPQRPTNTYGSTKLAIETMIGDFVRAHGFRAMIFRYFNVAGAAPGAEIGEQHQPETHLVPLVIEAAMGKREAITIFGQDYPTPDGTCIRDYVHVEDLIAAHLLGLGRLMGQADRLGETSAMNLGIGSGYSVAEVIARTRAVTGAVIAAKPGPRRSGDPARLVCDASRAQAILGWQPVHDLDAMIRDAWNWHRRGGFVE